MTLCGVLKDILLIVASMVIWHTQVTSLQFFGYSLALLGLIYYKLGGDKIREYTGQMGRSWSEYGQTRPVQRKLVVLVGVVVFAFFTMGYVVPDYTSQVVKGYIPGAAGAGAAGAGAAGGVAAPVLPDESMNIASAPVPPAAPAS